jgi:PIN domain nuclease of toxin-antitoxin system
MILLDTNCLIWWINHHPDLSVIALGAIERERPGGEILISAIAGWEVATLAQTRQLGLRMEPAAWLARLAEVPEVRFVPVDHLIAAQSVELPGPFEGSQAERMVVATARRFGCPLVTANKRLQEYPHVRIIW